MDEKNILIGLAVTFATRDGVRRVRRDVYQAYWKGALDVINGTGVASSTGAATTNYAAS